MILRNDAITNLWWWMQYWWEKHPLTAEMCVKTLREMGVEVET